MKALIVSMTNLQFDQQGDVVLELADKSRLQVSSKVLSLASPVFKAMFAPTFAEGSALVKGGNCHVHLSDDNPAAITLLCMILYHRSDVLKVEVGAELMDDMAILADKYDCTRSMGLWSALSLRKKIDEFPETAPLDRLLFPTIAFDEPEHLQLVTKRMVYTVTNAGFDAAGRVPVRIREMVPDGLLCMSKPIGRFGGTTHVLTGAATLMTKYRKIRKEILSCLDDVVTHLLVKPSPDKPGLNQEFSPHAKSDRFELPYHHKHFFSECNSNHFSAYMKEMHKQGLRNIGGELNNVSLSQIIAKLENCTFPEIPHVRRGSTKCDSCSLDFESTIAEILSKGRQAFSGLCLYCVNHGEKGSKGGCRIVHSGGPGAWGLK